MARHFAALSQLRTGINFRLSIAIRSRPRAYSDSLAEHTENRLSAGGGLRQRILRPNRTGGGAGRVCLRLGVGKNTTTLASVIGAVGIVDVFYIKETGLQAAFGSSDRHDPDGGPAPDPFRGRAIYRPPPPIFSGRAKGASLLFLFADLAIRFSPYSTKQSYHKIEPYLNRMLGSSPEFWLARTTRHRAPSVETGCRHP